MFNWPEIPAWVVYLITYLIISGFIINAYMVYYIIDHLQWVS